MCPQCKELSEKIATLERELAEIKITHDSLLVELWEGVRIHGLIAPKHGRDGERLIHAYCGGIARAHIERDELKKEIESL